MSPNTEPAAPETEQVEGLGSLLPALIPGPGHSQPPSQLPTGVYRTQPREMLTQDCEDSRWQCPQLHIHSTDPDWAPALCQALMMLQ